MELQNHTDLGGKDFPLKQPCSWSEKEVKESK